MAVGEVRVLGPMEVVGDDGRVPVSADKHRRLLAVLVARAGRACSVDELVEGVWGARPPASARKLLQIYVSQVRKVLPRGITVATRPDAYALELPAGALDAERFERLVAEAREARAAGNAVLAESLARRALDLWRGRAYGEYALEEFARGEAERLEELQLEAREELFAVQLELGRHAEVLGDLLAHAREHPLRERLHELAMLALYRCGRQSDALEHFAAARAHYDAELGLEPGPALRDLHVQILRQDAALLAPTLEAPTSVTLPAAAGLLVGRGRELGELGRLLARRESRLLVLTGAGGSGKTRLALEAAREAAGSFANGAKLVELAPVRDASLVAPTIARVLEVAEDGGEPPAEALARTLAPQELLLVVDNAEHLREAAPLFPRLLARAPRLTLLVTSRAVLHVSGEHVFPVAPLVEEDAVELFVQRARQLQPAFVVSGANEEDVREICRRVDCLPLPIELAAARIRTLSTPMLRERLESRLGLLTGGPRDLPARQRTLRETVAWSVDLLDEPVRRVFTRLAVLPGGATLDTAEVVCGADVDTLATLVDDHLLHRDDAGGETRFGTPPEPRFRMLETIREYALELLGDRRADVELALAEYFARFADESGLNTPHYGLAVEALEPEVDNLRQALAAAGASGDAELFVRLAGGLWRYWHTRGPVGEGLDWIERALAAGNGPASPARARALHGGAGLAWSRGDLQRAKALAQAAIPVAVASGSKWAELSAHTVLGIVTNSEGDHATARLHHQRSLELREELGEEPLVEKLNLGNVALDSGDHAEALRLFGEVLASHRRDGNTGGVGFAVLNLGEVYHALGDHGAARAAFEEGRVCMEQVGQRAQAAYALIGLGAAEASEARFEEAARLLGQARRELDDTGQSGDEFAEIVAWAETRARAALGDDAFEAAFAAGAAGRVGAAHGDRR